MSEGPKPVLPLRLGALLTVDSSVRVRITARADALQIGAPFGDLTVPYRLISRVRRVNGGIRLDLPGSTLLLEFTRLPNFLVNYLLDIINHEKRTPQP